MAEVKNSKKEPQNAIIGQAETQAASKQSRN